MSEPKFSFTDRAKPIAQVGLGDRRVDGDEAALWDDAEWDDASALWAGTEPFWLDISCDTHQAEMFYGRRRSTDRFSKGTLSLTASNESGWADITPPEGDPSLLDLRAGRAIRVGVDHSTLGIVWRWRGYIDSLRPRYDPVKGSVVDISAVCAKAEAGRARVAKLAVAVGANELAGTRISRILTAGKWSAALRSVDATGVDVLETVLGDSVANLLDITADSAGGAVFGDTEGRVVFKGRDWQIFMDDEPNDGTIGNVDVDDVCPTGWFLSEDRRDIVTQVEVARTTDATPSVVNDTVGQALYGVEPYKATDLICVSSTDLTRIRTRTFETRGYRSVPKVERVTLDASTGDAALDLMTTATVFDPSRYRCRLELERGEVFDREMLATGVREFISQDRWEMALDLDWAEPWMANGAEWDVDGWDQSTWN